MCIRDNEHPSCSEGTLLARQHLEKWSQTVIFFFFFGSIFHMHLANGKEAPLSPVSGGLGNSCQPKRSHPFEGGDFTGP